MLILPKLTNTDALEIGQVATSLSADRSLLLVVVVCIGDWIVYHASLPGSTPENDWWLGRKARVVNLKKHSTMYERVLAEKNEIDWFKVHNLLDKTHAIRLSSYRKGEKVSVDAKKVVVADTVGAGDTVGAILVEAIVEEGLSFNWAITNCKVRASCKGCCDYGFKNWRTPSW